MPLKKSEIYSRLWASCDALRGGMDASQYKDYVLAMLFLKYVSDKATDDYSEIEVPEGASFADAVALKGRSDIGDQLNKKIFEKIASENGLPQFANFNDDLKLGKDSEKRDRLEKLIGIFEDLDFSSNRAGGDDILGDAYEYLMRNFATQSGKSKGQFYTPAEVSRVIAGILGISEAKPTAQTTAYDPTCGSGSLLLKVADAAGIQISLYGQEKDVATQGLARMNMILHGFATAEIAGGNTLASPAFTTGHDLKRFDYVVANPPFSDKEWSMGLLPDKDDFRRFACGVPPAKNGDFAYLLHIIASMKSTGKAVCVLPHGVLFRGNAEAGLRQWLIRQGYISGIIGLPANLFYGTGIPAALIVLDKENASARKGIFMIDASQSFAKDGSKNRLRERDIHKITDVFNKRREISGYSHMASHAEIEKNDYNLNLPRYIDNTQKEPEQDIEAHLHGGIPLNDIDALQNWWKVCPTLKNSLFSLIPDRPDYAALACDADEVRHIIWEHGEFQAWLAVMAEYFLAWREKIRAEMREFTRGDHPAKFGKEISENLLLYYQGTAYPGRDVLDPYEPYQKFMELWEETIQDDCWHISQNGWKPEITPIYSVVKKGKNKGQKKEKGWHCDLTPKNLVIARFFADDQQKLDEMRADLDAMKIELEGMEEEDFGRDDSLLPLQTGKNEEEDDDPAGRLQVDKKAVKKLIKEWKKRPDMAEECRFLQEWLKLSDNFDKLKKDIKEKDKALDAACRERIGKLVEGEVKTLVIDDKWLAMLEKTITESVEAAGQSLVGSVSGMAERYATPLTELEANVKEFEVKVASHLERMGFKWQ